MKVVCFLGSLLFFGIAHSAIPLEGWYGGLMIGPARAFNLNFNLSNPFTHRPAVGELNYKTSVNVGGQLGYRYDKFRSEAQLIYDQSKFNHVQIDNLSISSHTNFNGPSLSGNTNFFAAMFNTFYEFYQEDVEVKLVPYVGLGVGYATVRNSVSLLYNQQQIFGRSDNASAPMGQGIIGINYFFSDSRSLALDYRYTTTPKHQRLNSSVAIEAINLVVNLSFD